jgi:hypothetical protein
VGGYFSFGVVNTVPFFVTPMIAFTKNAIVCSTGESYEYRIYGSDGRLISVVQAALPPTPITTADIQSARQKLKESTRSESDRQRTLEIFDGLKLPTTQPAIDRLLTEPNGAVWIRSYDASGRQDEHWARFDSTGHLQASIAIPNGKHVIRFRDDRVVLLHEDRQTGLQQVEVYSLETHSGPP